MYPERCTALTAVSISKQWRSDWNRFQYNGVGYFVYANEELAHFALNRLHGLKVGRWNLSVRMSNRAISYGTSRAGMLVGQPRCMERIFDTVETLTAS